jgi:hypothetical protein
MKSIPMHVAYYVNLEINTQDILTFGVPHLSHSTIGNPCLMYFNQGLCKVFSASLANYLSDYISRRFNTANSRSSHDLS